MEYPTSGIPNGGNTQRPEYPTEKLSILVIGYSGQNDRNTQQWNAQRRNTQRWNVIQLYKILALTRKICGILSKGLQKLN